MAKWNFSVVGGSLVKALSGADIVSPRSQSFMQPSIDLGKNYITFKESGQYKTALMFNQIGTIAGATPSSLSDAYTKLLALIPV